MWETDGDKVVYTCDECGKTDYMYLSLEEFEIHGETTTMVMANAPEGWGLHDDETHGDRILCGDCLEKEGE